MEQNQDRRRRFHRGRRGSDRRSLDRRAQAQTQERQGGDQVDVEQIMREIRARIAQRQGADLTSEQIQDLAARRLESILDPRSIKPSLLEGLRRNAGVVTPTVAPKASTEPVYTFEDTTIYDSHRAVLRFVRKLLNPLLKLFFNPNPLIRALHLQARLNVDAAAREGERERRQAEWNALHYEIVQRLVTEISRLSIEVQALSTRVESLAGRVDFNDRRVRGVEGTVHQMRPAGRQADAAPGGRPAEAGPGADAGTETALSEGARRRRRRRRGRRGSVVPAEAAGAAAAAPSASVEPEQEPVGEPAVDHAPLATAAEPEPPAPQDEVVAASPAPAGGEPPVPAAPAPESDTSYSDTDRSEQ